MLHIIIKFAIALPVSAGLIGGSLVQSVAWAGLG